MRHYEGNHMEIYGYEGWPELEDHDLANELPDTDDREEEIME